MKKRTKEEKLKIIAEVEKRKKNGELMKVIRGDLDIGHSDIFNWKRLMGLNKKSKHTPKKRTHLLELPMPAQAVATKIDDTQRVALFVGNPEAICTIFKNMLGVQ